MQSLAGRVSHRLRVSDTPIFKDTPQSGGDRGWAIAKPSRLRARTRCKHPNKVNRGETNQPVLSPAAPAPRPPGPLQPPTAPGPATPSRRGEGPEAPPRPATPHRATTPPFLLRLTAVRLGSVRRGMPGSPPTAQPGQRKVGGG